MAALVAKQIRQKDYQKKEEEVIGEVSTRIFENFIFYLFTLSRDLWIFCFNLKTNYLTFSTS